MADITERYRTKYPPKEHEEAVRMLLDGIKQQHQTYPQHIKTATSGSAYTKTLPARGSAAYGHDNNQNYKTNTLRPINTNHKNNHSGDYDRRSINSSGSEVLSENASRSATSGDGDDVPIERRVVKTNGNPKMQSKSTSTSDSVSLSSGIDNRAADLQSSSSASSNGAADASNEEAIPSRTIAVQCDLKLSSAKNSEGVFDGAMQVSSISSTRYGFYKLSPETLEARRRLKRSMSSRNVAPTQTTGTLLRRTPLNPNQVETPTSMSELSSSSPSLDGGRELDSHKSSHFSVRKPMSTVNLRRDYEREVDHTDLRSYDDDDNNNNNDENREPTRLLQKHGLKVDRSNSRVASLARRPKTALSYVSTSRLRDEMSPSRAGDSSDSSSGGRHSSGRRNGALRCSRLGGYNDRESQSPSPTLMRTRAVSHQFLPRSRTPAPAEEGAVSSDSEIVGYGDEDHNDRNHHSNKYNLTKNPKHHASDKFQVPCKEEIQVECAKCQPSPEVTTTLTRRSSSRPIKYDEANEFMRKYDNNNTEDLSTLQRSTTRRPIGAVDHETLERRKPLRHNVELDDELEGQQAEVATTCYTADEVSIDEANLGPIQRHQSLVCKPQASHHHHHHHHHHRRQPLVGQHEFSSTPRHPHAAAAKPAYESRTLSHDDRAYSQAIQSENERHASTLRPSTLAAPLPTSGSADVMRSTSMRHMSRLSRNGGMRFNHRQQQQDDQAPVYTAPLVEPGARMAPKRPQELAEEVEPQSYSAQMFKGKRPLGQVRHPQQHESEDSESPSTRTWANPSAEYVEPRPAQQDNSTTKSHHNPGHQQKPSRSYSMREVNQAAEDGRYGGQQPGRQQPQVTARDDAYVYDSSSESSILDESVQARRQRQFLAASQLDYDSQHRINEIGLPETHSIDSYSGRPAARHSHLHNHNHSHGHHKTQSGAASCLGVPSLGLRRSNDMLSRHLGNGAGGHHSGRPVLISGRAMSQQSLSRPTMPPTGGRRRATGSNSGSDVGGSSMSLVSRLHGRYENAHTRSPLVMYIPQATPRSQATSDCEASNGVGKSGYSRKSTRSVKSRKMSSSQDRLRRSNSRNGSDSESSSMLRTLVKPRGGISRRSSRLNVGGAGNHLDEGEDMDGVGQLASELDSYKFKRRYSVPKDAKINWFAKLKNRVTSSRM